MALLDSIFVNTAVSKVIFVQYFIINNTFHTSRSLETSNKLQHWYKTVTNEQQLVL